MLALGRLITKHDDGATIGYDEVDASNVVVAFELIDCELALLQVVDIDEDGFDPNDDIEFDTFAVVTVAVIGLLVATAAAVADATAAVAVVTNCSLKLH